MTYFAESLKNLRLKKNLSMQELADLAGVSKSMISKIERDAVQPTLDVAARLSKSLGKNLSEMLHTPQTTQIVYLPKNEQTIWEDAKKIKRRNISPVFEGVNIEWLLVEMPGGTEIKKCAPPNGVRTPKYLLVKEGTLTVKVGEEKFVVHKDDSLYFDASVEHEFHNLEQTPVQYYIVFKHLTNDLT